MELTDLLKQGLYKRLMLEKKRLAEAGMIITNEEKHQKQLDLTRKLLKQLKQHPPYSMSFPPIEVWLKRSNKLFEDKTPLEMIEEDNGDALINWIEAKLFVINTKS